MTSTSLIWLFSLVGLALLLQAATVLVLATAFRQITQAVHKLGTELEAARGDLHPALDQVRRAGAQVEQLATVSAQADQLLRETREELVPTLSQVRRTSEEVERLASAGRMTATKAGRMCDAVTGLSDKFGLLNVAGRVARGGVGNVGVWLGAAKEAAKAFRSRGQDHKDTGTGGAD
ncbi:MAG TPA: hypothetical protein VGN26_11930 [Armatimonadota bacterium]|jgi:hypothetical protein